jgi:hypothetical protein
MTFLFRNPLGEVEWAYPVTAARTRITLLSAVVSASTRLEASTRLRRPSCKGNYGKNSRSLSRRNARIARLLHIDINSELNYRVAEADAQPLVYTPMVNFGDLDDPSIVDAF